MDDKETPEISLDSGEELSIFIDPDELQELRKAQINKLNL